MITPHLEIMAADDGTWLVFRSDTKTAMVRVETLAEKHSIGKGHGIIGSTLLGWCRDRQKEKSKNEAGKPA